MPEQVQSVDERARGDPGGAVSEGPQAELRGDRERFWQARYFDRNIGGEAARSGVIRYIHRNPVKRGLVVAPEQYRRSSFSHYVTGERGVVEIESEWTARLRRPLIAIKLR
ncbi:MAG TPA: hypothetical protein VN753_09475 [Terracidiphilus sp.]|nr:hypothetical protein [Terracidiphilus sp.]